MNVKPFYGFERPRSLVTLPLPRVWRDICIFLSRLLIKLRLLSGRILQQATDQPSVISFSAKSISTVRWISQYVEAAARFRNEAEIGDTLSQAELGGCYQNGLGVEKNYVEAYEWYLLAVVSSFGFQREQLIKKRDEIEKLLTSEQIAKAQKWTREWKRKSLPQLDRQN